MMLICNHFAYSLHLSKRNKNPMRHVNLEYLMHVSESILIYKCLNHSLHFNISFSNLEKFAQVILISKVRENIRTTKRILQKDSDESSAESDKNDEVRFDTWIVSSEEIPPHLNPYPQPKLQERKKLSTLKKKHLSTVKKNKKQKKLPKEKDSDCIFLLIIT